METLHQGSQQKPNEEGFRVYPDLTTAIVRPVTTNGLTFHELLNTIKTGIIQTSSHQ